MSQSLILSAKLSVASPELDGTFVCASKILHEFPAKKILSPGIAQACCTNLTNFLSVVGDPRLQIPTEFESTRKLQAEELRRIALLVENGERVIDSTLIEEVGSQTLVIKLKPAEKA